MLHLNNTWLIKVLKTIFITTGLSGFDAVRLWYQYKRGSQAALDTLVRYNIEDIQNLETIIEMLYPSLMENAYQ